MITDGAGSYIQTHMKEELRFRDKVKVAAQSSKVFRSFTPGCCAYRSCWGRTQDAFRSSPEEEAWAAEARFKTVDNAGGGGEEEDGGEKPSRLARVDSLTSKPLPRSVTNKQPDLLFCGSFRRRCPPYRRHRVILLHVVKYKTACDSGDQIKSQDGRPALEGGAWRSGRRREGRWMNA